MQKPKEYDWKDSNMALFGSDTEKQVKKESAVSEKAWKGSGQKVGIEIWRINKFKVEKWPKEDYGKFYNGDSYIILNTYKDPEGEEFLMDVHFWIGKYSTQDEYATAAYKTVELDTFHDDKPIQHREVMGYESALFKSYFEEIMLMKGGADTGFKRVGPESYQTRLLQVWRDDSQTGRRKKVTFKEIPLKRGNLNSDDVFIFDFGNQIYQYNGTSANKDEKFNATQRIQKMRSERGGKPETEVLEEQEVEEDHPILACLKDGKSKEKSAVAERPKAMFAISDADDSLDLYPVLEGSLDRKLLTSDDVFLCDTGSDVYLYVGINASIDERHNAMGYAHRYLQSKDNPCSPVTVVAEGQKCPQFDSIFSK